jgi:hypothetical protein
MMKDFELRINLEFLDRVTEQLISNSTTPNMEQTLQAWNQQSVNRKEKEIMQLKEVQRVIQQIIEGRVNNGS